MFRVAFSVSPWGTNIVTAFSMASHQVLFKSLLPSRVKLTATKISYQLHVSLHVAAEIEALKHNVCMLLPHVLAGFCLRDSQSICLLAQTCFGANCVQTVAIPSTFCLLLEEKLLTGTVSDALPVPCSCFLWLLVFSICAISATLFCTFPAGWG